MPYVHFTKIGTIIILNYTKISKYGGIRFLFFTHISCVNFSGNWSDLGDWNAVAEQLAHDDNGNIIIGTASQIDCENTTLWSVAAGTQLVGLGLENIVTVVMNDAVLVADSRRMQDVRQVVDQLETEDIILRDYGIEK